MDTRKLTAWLRDTDEGRDVVAKAAARICRECPRIRNLLAKCAKCEHKRRPAATSELLDSLPPHSLDSEAGVIGSVLLDPTVYAKVKPPLAPEDFYGVANAAIWTRMREALDAGQPMDTTLLAERLKAAGEWDDVGGAVYLAEVLNSVAVAAHAPHYAAIVREKAGLRRLVWQLCALLKACYEPDASFKSGPLAELLQSFKSKLNGYKDKP